MKTTIKIAAIAMMGIALSVSAQEKVTTENGAKSDFIYNDGKVGIGTTIPTEKLEINDGNLRIFGENTSRYIRFGENNFQGAYINYDGTKNILHLGVHHSNTADINDDYNSLSIVRSNGYIGINTTSPAEKLEINEGNLRIFGENTSRYIRFGENNFQGAYINYDGTKNILHLGVHQSNTADVNDDYNSLSIVRSNGYIGIGTTTPAEKLDVNGNTSINGDITVKSDKPIFWLHNKAINNERSGEIRLTETSGRFQGGGIKYNGITNQLKIFTHNTDDLDLAKDFDALVFNRSNGNAMFGSKVGIGTTSTGNHRLAVEGSIGAREIKVEANGWSDFVFYDDYKLPTLQEVAQHIKEKGHLKDIPSAEDVEENGFYLGEMDSKLLQKIEELTLYTIQQDKEIKELKKQNAKIEAQEKKIEKLEALVEQLLKK